MLIRGNAFLVLDLALDVVDSIAGLDLESDGLAGDYGSLLADVEDGVANGRAQMRELTGLDEDLHDGGVKLLSWMC